tara:strand:+ start:201 stop:455 length:255 start_codon:yes stop_codon:yes gene_type:complete
MKTLRATDNKGRDLVTVEPVNGKAKINLHRYADMTEKDKIVVRTAFKVLKASNPDAEVVAFDASPINDIEAFMRFNEDKPDLCG